MHGTHTINWQVDAIYGFGNRGEFKLSTSHFDTL